MSSAENGSALDPVIHAQARLKVMVTLSTLHEGDRISFPRLREVLSMTSGNLSIHLRRLEDAGHISKTHQDARPSPTSP